MTGSSELGSASETTTATAFDQLARGAADGLSRRQLAKLGGAIALTALLPSKGRSLNMRRTWWARAASATTGTCPRQARQDCGAGATSGAWTSDCPRAVPNGQAAQFNGCGPQSGIHIPLVGTGKYVPDNPLGVGDLFDACKFHDCCYGTCGTDKSFCDETFFGLMLAVCDKTYPRPDESLIVTYEYMYCLALARTYYEFVSNAGEDAYNSGQSEVCDCCDRCRSHGDCAIKGPDFRCCRYACTDVSTQRGDCGGCGITCDNTEDCVNGQCKQHCPQGQTYCTPNCVDTQTDPGNCGGCGNACASGETCVTGTCRSCGGQPCGPPNTCCNNQCVNTQTDASNCGACGNACPTGELCQSGACGCGGASCGPPNTCCNNQCVNTQTDASNCGACGNACPTGELCQSGACGCGGASCGPPNTCCNNQCVNTQTDPSNCGACGNACPSGQTCCSGQCVDTNTDAKNCGACGNACTSGAVCDNGNCHCPPNWTLCYDKTARDYVCVDTFHDDNNCGGCGIVCSGARSHCAPRGDNTNGSCHCSTQVCGVSCCCSGCSCLTAADGHNYCASASGDTTGCEC